MIRHPAEAVAERTVIQANAREWLAEHAAPEGTSVITSLPDVSEMPALGLSGWREWFVEAAGQVIEWVPEAGVSIFFQSDVRSGGTWVDKGYLVQRAADLMGANVVWHKIVCRLPPGTPTWGRSSYSHLICVSRRPLPPPRHATPDVLPDAGPKPWTRAMGLFAGELACRFLRDETTTRVVVDPYCGSGMALAIANRFGFTALGVELSARRCRAARNLNLEALSRPNAEASAT